MSLLAAFALGAGAALLVDWLLLRQHLCRVEDAAQASTSEARAAKRHAKMACANAIYAVDLINRGTGQIKLGLLADADDPPEDGDAE